MASTSIQLKQPGEGASCVSDDDELLLLDEDELIVDDNKAALKNTLQIKRVSTGDTVFLNNSNNATSTNIISGRRRFRADPNCAARSHRRQPQISITEQYYGRSTDYTENTQYTSTNVDIDLERGGFTNSKPQSSTQQSRRLPPWLWQTICHLLGVPVQTMPVGNTPQSRLQSCATRPWLGLFIQIVTVIVALIYATTYTCYTAYDIKNIYTKQTLLMGLVHIVIALYWCAMGLYSRSRAASLFQCKRFAASVRVHSKTVFRISSAGILVLLSTTLVVLNDVSSAHTFEAKTCHKLGLPGPLCQVMYISRVLFSIFALLWNLLVAILLLSVCRTHTIGIRRFIRELESDGFTYELLQRHAMLSNENMTEVCSVNDGEDDYVWDDDIPQSLSHDIAPTKQQQQQQQQHLKTLASLSRRRRSTLSLPASASGCGSIIPDGRSSAFLSVENVSQHNAGNLGNHAQNPGSQSNTTLPSIVIGDNVMVDYCNLENETSEGQRGARSKRSPVHSVPDDESSDQPGPVPGVSAGVSNFGMTLDCDESTAEVSSSVMAHASPPGEELPQWRKYTATRTRPVCSDYGGLEDGSLEDVSLSDIQILSNNSILLSYWKISCRLRTTSIVLQRWLMAVIMFIMLWNVTYIIHWVSHQTTVLGIAQFVIPLLLLPIICSAYAEVNMEGRRMLKSICPTPGRMDMLFYLAQQPLEVTAFGFPINYSTIVKAMGAMVLAFCTRLILDEINM